MVGALRDRLLKEAALGRARGTATRLDFLEQRPCLALDPLRERLDVPAPASGVDDFGHTGLVGENLLRAERERGALLGGQR